VDTQVPTITLEKTEGAIRNGQSRDIDNNGFTGDNEEFIIQSVTGNKVYYTNI
jgi:hypothetical protein